MNADEIIKLLDCIIGNIEPIGETNVDKKVLENINKLIEIIEHYLYLLDVILYNNEEFCNYYSIANVVERIKKFKNDLKEELENV